MKQQVKKVQAQVKKKERVPSTRTREPAVLALLPYGAAIFACLPILAGGFPRGHDWGFELVRTAEYGHALAAGQIPPFWAENLYGGYGSPVFLFYAPLFSAVASLLSFFFSSVPRGASASIVLFAFLAVTTMGWMMKAILRDDDPAARGAARTAACLYVLSPYLIGDHLLRNANAEFAALAFAPLALAGLFLMDHRPRRGFFLLASGFALVILAHNIIALVVAAMLAAAALVMCYPFAGGREPVRIVLAGALGLALSAFFWVPALTLTGLVRMDQLTGGYLDFHRHFAGPVASFGYEQFFAVGLLLPLCLAAAGGVACLTRAGAPRERKTLLLALGGAAAFLFLQTRASTLLWEQAPFLSLFQFPWRMLGPFSLCAAAAAGAAFMFLLKGRPVRIVAAAELALVVLAILNASPRLLAYEPLEAAVAERLPGDLKPGAIRESGATVTLLDEYLPRHARQETWRAMRPVAGGIVKAEPPVRITAKREGGAYIALTVEADAPSRLRVARWAFPGWEVDRGGRKSEALPNEFGSFDLEVPAGKSEVTLRLRPPVARRVCLAVSGVALGIFLCASGWWRPKRRRVLPVHSP